MDGIASLTEQYATKDRGGGVALGNCFMVYTKATSLSPIWYHRTANTGYPADLVNAAVAIERSLPVHDRHGTEHVALTSLPVPSDPPYNDVERLPWFFMHASVSKKHGIVGEGCMVQTMLLILHRPWCVLELCCSNSSLLRSVLGFLRLAARDDSKTYGWALSLVEYELSRRASCQALPEEERFGKAKLHHVCAGIFLASVNSFNGLWLRTICTCAIKLDIPVSDVGRLLSSSVDPSLQMPCIQSPFRTAQLLSMPKRPAYCSLQLRQNNYLKSSSSFSGLPRPWSDAGTSKTVGNGMRSFLIKLYAETIADATAWVK